MKYSPIAPIALLQDLHSHDLLGDYHLVLAHDILAHATEYKKLFASLRTKYKSLFVILDNSVIELDSPMSLQALLEASNIINPNCIVMPDIIGDADATVNAALRFWSDYEALESLPLMAVPQGQTITEHVLCARLLSQIPLVKYWGIPRRLTNEFGSRQIKALMFELGYGEHYNGINNIHMLGMSKNFQDDMESTKLQGVMGIDSANPCTLGTHGILIEGSFSTPHILRGNYWATTKSNKEIRTNIRFVREVLNDM